MNPQPFKRPSILEAESVVRARGGKIIENPTLKPGAVAYDHPNRTLHHHPDTPPADYLAALIYAKVLIGRNDPTLTRAGANRAIIVTYEHMLDPAQYWRIYETHLTDPRARAQALDVPAWVLEAWEARFNRDHCERLINALREQGIAERIGIDEFYRDYYKPHYYAQHLAPREQERAVSACSDTEPRTEQNN